MSVMSVEGVHVLADIAVGQGTRETELTTESGRGDELLGSELRNKLPQRLLLVPSPPAQASGD